MRLLLDTHALLWWFTDDAQLSTQARAAIADETNETICQRSQCLGNCHQTAHRQAASPA